VDDQGALRDVTGLLAPTSQEQFEAWRRRELPAMEQVRDGVWSLPLPLPAGNAMGYVSCYALVGGDGLALIDPGWDHEEGWRALLTGLASLGASIQDVQDVVVTHFHPDHFGLASRVRTASGARIRMHAQDAAITVPKDEPVDATLASIEEFLLTCGAPEDEVAGLVQERKLIERLHAGSGPDGAIAPGEVLTLAGHEVRAVWTPGHTPGHLCFLLTRDGLLVSGDHVLPRVSPNVSSYDHSDRDPLGDFLRSLTSLVGLGVTEVLPAHEYRFADLQGRVDELQRHHDERLALIQAFLRDRGPSSSWALAEVMPWSRPWDDMAPYTKRSANGEVLAHLVQLERRGLAQRSNGRPFAWSVVPVTEVAVVGGTTA